MDVLALILTVAAMLMFLFAASGRELRRFNEIAVGLVLLTAALICQFTSITNTHIGRLARAWRTERGIRHFGMGGSDARTTVVRFEWQAFGRFARQRFLGQFLDCGARSARTNT